MQSWFIETPEALEYELSRLQELGLEYKIDEVERDNDFLVIYIDYQIEDETLKLKCHFPASYPYFPFEIICDNFPTGRHIEPDSNTLCLFSDQLNNWDIRNDTLAEVINTRVKEIYHIHKNAEQISEHEEQNEGYQISGQLITEQNSVIVTMNENEPQGNYGQGELLISEIRADNQAIQGCFHLIYNNDETTCYESKSTYKMHFNKNLSIKWIKLDEKLKLTNASQILHQVIMRYPNLEKPEYKSIGQTIKAEIIAVCFPEETTRNTIEYNWTFIIRRQPKQAWVNECPPQLIKSDHIHSKYLLARTPNLTGLNHKRVAIIGLGALGSHLAWQLARAGIKKFSLVDKDYLQAGNLQRWLGALPFIGVDKSTAVAHLLSNNYVDIEAMPYLVGIGYAKPIKDHINKRKISVEEYLIQTILADADIVIDCTAMLSVNQYLAHVCKQHKIDYVWCSATNGAWGGIVGRAPASYENDVWLEFNKAYGENKFGTISTEPEKFVQPKGCFHPTFTGTGFDLDTISIMATRMVVGMLQPKYGQFDFDVAILEQFRDNQPIAPEWKTFSYKNE